jgi:hypothetical protein
VGLPPERRRQLQELGLRALVKRRFGAEVADGGRPVRFGGGAAIVAEGGESPTLAAVFADTPAGLGPAIDLAHREGAAHLYFFAEHNTGATARRAAQFRLPTTVVNPDGDFEALEPDPPDPVEPVPPALAAAGHRMTAAGLDVEWEHGLLTGEWLGLEVARADGDALAIGVGKHDRDANVILHPEGPSDQFLDQAIAIVRDLRRPDARPHPANLLAGERWLRAILVRHPHLVGVDELHAAQPPEARRDLRQRAVAPAWGVDAAGIPTVVVCSVGVDPDLIAQAADARAQSAGWPGFPSGGPRLVVVVPEGDDHPLTRRLAVLLRHPAEVTTTPSDWRRMGAS